VWGWIEGRWGVLGVRVVWVGRVGGGGGGIK